MPEYTGPRGLFRNSEIIRHTKRLPRNNRVLEIGAGKLGLSTELSRHFDHVTAIDLSPEILEAARSIPEPLQKKVDVLVRDIFAIELEQTYDVVVACEVLEHIEDEQEFIHRIDTLLNSRGCLIISVPAHMRLWSRHDELVGHLRRYERADLNKIANWIAHDQVDIVAYGFPWINILRWFRIALASVMLGPMQSLTTQERTVASGQLHKGLRFLNLFVNKYTIWPFSLFSLLFTKSDYSDGYLLFLRKE